LQPVLGKVLLCLVLKKVSHGFAHRLDAGAANRLLCTAGSGFSVILLDLTTQLLGLLP